jgi:hypothetical protein
MAYRIAGLAPEPFAHLFGLPDEALASRGVLRLPVTGKPGFPCRITLEDAEPGESVLLLHYESHSADTPYRSAYAIYVREGAGTPAVYKDALPPVFEGRPIALRAFDAAGMLRGAALALHGDADAQIRALFERPEIAYLHAHNAAYGCFAAKVERA